LARDCNACFSQIFEERTFGKLTPDEMNIFSSLRTFQSFCKTCQKDVVLNSSILVNFVTRSALQKCELNYNSWPQFVSAIQTQPGKLNCPDCETFTCEPVLTSIADSKFVLIELSPELMNVVKLYALKPRICCPEIQNVVIDTHAICNTKACKTRITGNTESKNMVRCTSCNRAMLVRNCYLEINTTFQSEKDDKQYNVMANQNTISNYLDEDIFQYKDNVDELMEKLLLLENVDFELSTNGRMVTEMVDHQDKPDEPTKDN